MSRYKDHPKPRRHRDDDEPFSFPEKFIVPSFFQRPPPAVAAPVDAQVKGFNASKGFGFVKASDGTEAYLPVGVLEAIRSHGGAEGAHIEMATNGMLYDRIAGSVQRLDGRDRHLPTPTEQPPRKLSGKSDRTAERSGERRLERPPKGKPASPVKLSGTRDRFGDSPRASLAPHCTVRSLECPKSL